MNRKLSFLQMLRGGAALSVMISHLLFMFFLGNEAIAQIFPYLPQVFMDLSDFNILFDINQILNQAGVNFGAYGVAIFFLISGFVISLSLEHKRIKQFIGKRFLRIWPTYIAGFSVTFLMIWIYTRINDIDFPYHVKDYFFQISLLRDWFWKPSLDAVSWTLEAEIKFYIVMCIFFYLKKARSKNFISLAAVTMFLFNFITSFSMDYLLLKHIKIYYFFNTVQFANVNILFMLLGVCIYNYYMRYWHLEDLVEMIVKIYLLLIFSAIFSVHRSNLQLYTSSYLFAFITFLIVFIFRDKIKNIKILNFFAEISYPFYIVHGLNGYIIETFLVQHNISPYICFLTAFIWSVLTAYILHITVERFSLKLFK